MSVAHERLNTEAHRKLRELEDQHREELRWYEAPLEELSKREGGTFSQVVVEYEDGSRIVISSTDGRRCGRTVEVSPQNV